MSTAESNTVLVEEHAGASLLVVDDDVTTQQILECVLSPHFQVHCVGTGSEALEAVCSAGRDYDIILLDLILPDISGFDVFSRLQASGRLQGVPVIFLTSRIEAENEVRGLDLGAIDYIHKPVNGDQLVGRVRRHLRAKSLYDFMSAQKEFLEKLLEEKNRNIEDLRRGDLV